MRWLLFLLTFNCYADSFTAVDLGSGGIRGPLSSENNRNTLWDGTTGRLLKQTDYTMPVGNGASGQVLTTDGNGFTDWVVAPSAVTGGILTIPYVKGTTGTTCPAAGEYRINTADPSLATLFLASKTDRNLVDVTPQLAVSGFEDTFVIRRDPVFPGNFEVYVITAPGGGVDLGTCFSYAVVTGGNAGTVVIGTDVTLDIFFTGEDPDNVKNSGAGVDDNIATFDGATGKLIKDSGVDVAQIETNTDDIALRVVGPISAVDDNIAVFDGVTGEIIKDSGVDVAQIGTNTTDIGTNAADIATNATDIATNAADIATNVTDIGTNATNIATNVTDIGTNATNIATNTSDISDNAADIATNTADIATNTSDIADKVTGPNSSQDNGMVRFDGTTGKIIQDSSNFITDGGLVDINLSGNGTAIQIDAPGGIAGTSDIRFQGGRGRIQYNSHMRIQTSDTSKDIIFQTNMNNTQDEVVRYNVTADALYITPVSTSNADGVIGEVLNNIFGISNANVFTPDGANTGFALAHTNGGATILNAASGQNMEFRNGNSTTKMRLNSDGIFGVVTTGTTTLEMKLCGCKVNGNGTFNSQYTEQCDLCFNGGAAQHPGTGQYILDFDNGFWLRAPVCNVTASLQAPNDHFCVFREDTNSTSIIRVTCLDNNNNNSPRDENFYITCFGVE